jgi:hypothetical protein
MKATLIVLGILALQFAVAVFLGKCIRAGHNRRCRESAQYAPCLRSTTPTVFASK